MSPVYFRLIFVLMVSLIIAQPPSVQSETNVVDWIKALIEIPVIRDVMDFIKEQFGDECADSVAKSYKTCGNSFTQKLANGPSEINSNFYDCCNWALFEKCMYSQSNNNCHPAYTKLVDGLLEANKMECNDYHLNVRNCM